MYIWEVNRKKERYEWDEIFLRNYRKRRKIIEKERNGFIGLDDN